MSTFIVNPLGDVSLESHGVAPRPRSLAGLRIGVLDNSKANARQILVTVGAEIAAKTGAIVSHAVCKPTASRPCPEPMFEEMLVKADVIVMGVGDCGSCTTWSVHDMAAFEDAGRPVSLIVTDVFKDMATAVAESLGYHDAPLAVTSHPIGGLARDELEVKGVAIVAEVEAGLVAR
jgi:hypothetical protein